MSRPSNAVRLLVVVVALVSACATPYQSRGIGGGFRGEWHTNRALTVTFTGNGFTSPERARTYALLRACDMANARGFAYLGVWTADAVQVQDTRQVSPGMATVDDYGGRETVLFTTPARFSTVNRGLGEFAGLALTPDDLAYAREEGFEIVDVSEFVRANAPPGLREEILARGGTEVFMPGQ